MTGNQSLDDEACLQDYVGLTLVCARDAFWQPATFENGRWSVANSQGLMRLHSALGVREINQSWYSLEGRQAGPNVDRSIAVELCEDVFVFRSIRDERACIVVDLSVDPFDQIGVGLLAVRCHADQQAPVIEMLRAIGKRTGEICEIRRSDQFVQRVLKTGNYPLSLNIVGKLKRQDLHVYRDQDLLFTTADQDYAPCFDDERDW